MRILRSFVIARHLQVTNFKRHNEVECSEVKVRASPSGSLGAVEQGQRVSESKCPLNSVVELCNMEVGLKAAIL